VPLHRRTARSERPDSPGLEAAGQFVARRVGCSTWMSCVLDRRPDRIEWHPRAVLFAVASPSPDWTAIAGLASTAIVGIAGIAGTWRRFGHERKLKATDDLVQRLDEVEVALTRLSDACAAMRVQTIQYRGDPEQVGDSWVLAVEAYHDARAVVARLSMRPHADRRLVDKANAVTKSMYEAIDAVGNAVKSHRAGRFEMEGDALLKVHPSIEAGDAATREYEALARDALDRLIG
jgi:hypothetical protein